MEPNGTQPVTNPTPPEKSAEADSAASRRTLLGAFELFTPSQKAVMLNLTSFVIIVLLPGLLYAVANTANRKHATWWETYTRTPGTHPVMGSIWLLAFVLSIITLGAQPYLELMSIRGKTIATMDAIKRGLHFFWRLLGLYIVTGLLIAVGFVLFIVPGVIFARRYFLASYFLVDKDLGIGEAMHQSAAATKGLTGAVWGVIGVMVLLSFASIIPLIGVFIAAILQLLYSCAAALRYEELHSN